MYAADGMTDGGRRLIEEKFEIPVLSVYNCVEVFKLGYQCEIRKGFHTHEDLCHVKIVNSNGEKVKEGEKGEVVISNLINRGSVLLNYRLGDIAASSNAKCPCGRNFPLLAELEGRMEDIIWMPTGQFVHPRTIWNVFKEKREILQYQFIQHEPLRFELKLVTVDRESYQRIIDGLRQRLQQLLTGAAQIESSYYAELPREGGGKFRPVISHCKPFEYA
jgi:phenylacetate-CoA ligase